MPTTQATLVDWEHRYNAVRPYQALGYLTTPQQFLDHTYFQEKEQVSRIT